MSLCKKLTLLPLTFALLMIPNVIYADSEIGNKSDGTIIYKQKEVKNLETVSSKKTNIKVHLDNRDFEFSSPNITSVMKNNSTGENVKVVDKQLTQLLEMKKKKDGSYVSSLVTTYAVATDATRAEKWVAGVTGYVTVYYHEQYHPSTKTKHVDMNYIYTRWDVPSGTSVKNRELLMYQKGKSNYGSHVSNASKTLYPSSNSAQKFDTPDEWIPIFEGLVGARTKSTIVKGGKSYSLEVKCNIMGG